MISLKVAVVGVSVVGAVAVGGVTWATVGQPDAAPTSAKDKLNAAAKQAPQLPQGLPSTPNPKQIQKVQPKMPEQAPQLPAAPKVPSLRDLNLNCKSAPAITVGSVLERDMLLSQGVKLTVTKVVPRKIGTQWVCSTVQTYVPKLTKGVAYTVERIALPVGKVAETTVRQALQIPDTALRRTNIGGAVVLTGAGGSGSLVLDPSGYAVYVNGAPMYAPSVQKIATAIAKEAATRG